MVDRAGLADDVRIDSFGTGPWHAGQSIDPRSAEALLGRGYPVPAHVARQLDAYELSERDLVLVADQSHLQDVRELAVDDNAEVALLRSFDPALAGLGEEDPELAIGDPYYGGAAGFERMLDEIEAACAGLVAQLPDRIAGR